MRTAVQAIDDSFLDELETAPAASFVAPAPVDDEREEQSIGVRDPVASFLSDVSQVNLLSREDEETLSRQIAAHRTRILRTLRTRRGLVARALSGVGRGLVHPDIDFREREALTVLTYARRLLASMTRLQRGRKALQAFVQQLDRDLAAYRTLRDRMMTANVRLVMTLARRYHHPTLSYLDLVQEGVLGLMRAVEKYEPSRGIKFSTYAVWWIWQQISRAADCQGAMIRTPVHWNQFRRKMGRAASQSEGQIDGASMAEEHGISADRMATMSQGFQCLSLASPLGDDDDRTLGDTLPANESDGPEGALLEADLSERLAEAVEELPPREAQILRLRFGLAGSRISTLEEIGQTFGVSRERIRQLEARALRRMRAICDAQGLTDLLQ